MVRALKEIYGLFYGELIQTAAAQEPLHIQRTLKYASGRGFFEDTPKTATSIRDIPLTKDMIAILDRQKQLYGEKFATRAIESGMKPQTLKTILGHASLSMTMDLYSHVLPTTRAEEMELIAKAF